MTSIKPGEEKLYEWTAEYAGVWMYHCGTAPALHHIANGMYGMVIVETEGGPAAGRPGVRHRPERVVPRSAGQGDRPARRPTAGAPAPDFVVFNGVANQYKDNPIQVGDRRAGPDLRPRRRAEHGQLVPHRRHDLQHGHQGRHPPRAGQRRQLGLARRSTSRPRRARSSSSRPPRTASTRWSPTPSTSSVAARSGSSRPATAIRRTESTKRGGGEAIRPSRPRDANR